MKIHVTTEEKIRTHLDGLLRALAELRDDCKNDIAYAGLLAIESDLDKIENRLLDLQL